MPKRAARSSSGANAGERTVGAVKLEPTATAQIALRAGFGGQLLVLADRARKQWPHQLCRLDQALRRRRGAKSRQPRRDPRQMRQVIVGYRRALQRDPRQLGPKLEGNAAGKTVLPSMMPALPYDVPSPGPPRSISATDSPRLASWTAMDVPTMPAPSTMTSVRARRASVVAEF